MGGFMMYGFAFCVSLGEPTPTAIVEGGSGVSGLHRSFQYTDNQLYLLLVWVFGTLWILETVTCLGQFMISGAVVSHVVHKTHFCFPVLRAFVIGIVFHLGSI